MVYFPGFGSLQRYGLKSPIFCADSIRLKRDGSGGGGGCLVVGVGRVITLFHVFELKGLSAFCVT